MPPLRMIFMFLFAVVAVNISNYIFYYRIYTPMNRNCFYVNRNISSQNSINTSTYLSFINNKDITSDNGVSETEYADLMVSLKGLYTFYPLEVKKQGLPRCPEKPPNLGPVVEDTVMKSLKAFDKLYSEVQIGGAYCPTKCVARQRVAIIVPFRNNKSRTNIRHLGTFMYMMHLFLMKQQLEYRIFVIEQANGNHPYNQGKLMNAGYTEVHRRRSGRYRFNCLIFHEPHIVPIDTRNLYRCSRFPRLLSSVLEKPDKLKNANYSIVRSNPLIGKYVQVKQFEVPVFNQSELAVTSSPLNLIDGLTTVKYKVNDFELKYIFTYINISLEDDFASTMEYPKVNST
uniref:Beta-1,4-N-acetylgalactosaminyltransferase n=1 Tax=Bombyx mori TaxID=7091 RepID=A0A8R2M7U8_BOMMO|nr:beta-1,4-galactosyltransferase 6 isoform X2 [Bombyx mori]